MGKLTARKGNKVYTVTEAEVEAYSAQGFDIYDGAKLKAHAKGKTVPIAEYERALAQIAELEAKAEGKKKG